MTAYLVIEATIKNSNARDLYAAAEMPILSMQL